MRLLITLCTTTLLLAACGIKGPLTLPPKQPPALQSGAAADHTKALPVVAAQGATRFTSADQS